MEVSMNELGAPTPEQGGWYLAAALAIAGIFKAVIERIQRRDRLLARGAGDAQEHKQGLEIKALAAEESATAQLVKILQGRVDKLEIQVIDQGAAILAGMRREAENARDLALKDARIAVLEIELARVRRQREKALELAARGVKLAALGASKAEAGELEAAALGLENELSEADEARSGVQPVAPPVAPTAAPPVTP